MVVLMKAHKTTGNLQILNPHDFIGLVLGYNEEEKYVDLEQRNNFKVGDKVEFCQPKGELVEAVIEK